MSELQLSKPITAHGETIHVLELREPTFDEIELIGFPFTIGSEGNIKIDSSVSLRYIPVLAGVPRSSASQMAKIDIFKASMTILGFFYRLGSGRNLRQRCYNVAHFWRINPLELKRSALSDFLELEEEAVRISEEIKNG
ncbi:phage tail assembly protein [Pantoea agglomerans]|nr:phage tail assembly protein [Pantoea agglomerans]